VRLKYNFVDEPYFEGHEMILVTMYNYVYEVDEEGDYEILLDKYRDKALSEAAYDFIKEYADTMY